MLCKSFASNGQVIKVGVDFKTVFLNKFVYRALEGRDAVGNTKRQAFVLKKLTISFQRRCSAVLQLTAALGDTPIEGQLN